MGCSWLAGDIGTLITDDGSGKPWKVEASNGATWWYKREAISGTCDVAGCSRATWNGDFEGQCCRTCKSSGGAKHGPDCEAKAKGGAGGSVRLEGAGGDYGSLCNGVYDVSGTHNGKPLYVQKGGKAKIYFNNFWKIAEDGDTGGWVFGVKSDAGKGALPPTTWRNDGYSGSDASPCPTLQFLSGVAAGCCVVTRENYCSGHSVVRGPSWKWQDQDGGTYLTSYE